MPGLPIEHSTIHMVEQCRTYISSEGGFEVNTFSLPKGFVGGCEVAPTFIDF